MLAAGDDASIRRGVGRKTGIRREGGRWILKGLTAPISGGVDEHGRRSTDGGGDAEKKPESSLVEGSGSSSMSDSSTSSSSPLSSAEEEVASGD